MLGLFSKKAMILGAPAAGQLLDITQVNDPFFASKNLGDGVAVIPQSQTVCALATAGWSWYLKHAMRSASAAERSRCWFISASIRYRCRGRALPR